MCEARREVISRRASCICVVRVAKNEMRLVAVGATNRSSFIVVVIIARGD